MTPYTILHFDDATKTCVIRLRDVAGGTHDLNVSAEGLMHFQLGDKNIQDCFPELTPDERELLMTGIPSNVWESIFNNEE